jgi:hypothetical protein
MRARFGAVARLVVIELEVAGILELRRCHFGGEVDVHRLGDAALQLAECIAGVLVHALRVDQPLAVLLQAFGRRLLVAELNARLGVFLVDRHVAGENQQRRSRGIRTRDRADHVGEAGAFGSGADRDLARTADEGVGGVRHRSFVASAVGGDPGRRDRVDDRVVARTGEHRRDALFPACAREDLRAGHRELERRQRGAARGRELRRDADGGCRRIRGGGTDGGGGGRAGAGDGMLQERSPAHPRLPALALTHDASTLM